MKAKPELDYDIEKLWLEGKSGGQIARKLGLSRNTVVGRAYRMGLTRNRMSTEDVQLRLAEKRNLRHGLLTQINDCKKSIVKKQARLAQLEAQLAALDNAS